MLQQVHAVMACYSHMHEVEAIIWVFSLFLIGMCHWDILYMQTPIPVNFSHCLSEYFKAGSWFAMIGQSVNQLSCTAAMA